MAVEKLIRFKSEGGQRFWTSGKLILAVNPAGPVRLAFSGHDEEGLPALLRVEVAMGKEPDPTTRNNWKYDGEEIHYD